MTDKVGIVEKAGPTTLESKVESNVASNMIRPEKDFLMGLEKDFREVYQDVEKKKKADPSYLFVDSDFPPDNSSLVFKNKAPAGVVWKRPHVLNKDAVLVKDGFGKSDVRQGNLGDCYFLAAAAALATTPKLLSKLIPVDQSLNEKGKKPQYNGLLQFRFWRYGKWVEVLVDDSLPTMAEYGLIYGRCSDPQEFWVDLAEKAYAKLNGSYEALNGGQNTETLEDMTGGLAIEYMIGSSDKNTVFKQVVRARRHRSFVCASLFAFGVAAKKVEEQGLVANHAYTVTGAANVTLTTGEAVKILRVRNPWGTSREWKGSFSDKSKVWEKVDDVTKKSLNFQIKGDAEWWMTLDDFWSNFSMITICTLGPDFNEDGDAYHLSWLMSTVRGEWAAGSSAGGCRNNATFNTNPQYLMHIEKADEPEPEDGEETETNKSFVQIGLMQEHRRVDKSTIVPNYALGITVFKLSDKRSTRLNPTECLTIPTAGETTAFVRAREVVLTVSVEPGYYVIVPATFSPNCSSSFYMRVFTENAIGLNQLEG